VHQNEHWSRALQVCREGEHIVNVSKSTWWENQRIDATSEVSRKIRDDTETVRERVVNTFSTGV
jgi:hypothetical protein